MKNLVPLALLVFVVAACNLSSKLKSNKNGETSSSSSSSSSSTSSPKVGDEPVEKPAPTDAQVAALTNGEEAKWDEQGITWTLPPGWKKQTVSTNSFNYSLGTQVFLIVSIAPMAPDFPTDISLNATHEAAKVRARNGEVDEVKWLELDGVRGAEFRESKPQMGSDLRRLQWLTYRKYAGQTQYLNLMLSGTADNFAKHQDELYAILYSTKLMH
jgi:hypothetical protein